MNKIDDILEQLKGQQPLIDDPDALTDRIMSSLPDLEPAKEVQMPQQEASRPEERRAQQVPMWRWLSVAASLLILIGIGVTLLQKKADPTSETVVAQVENKPVAPEAQPAEPQVVEPQGKEPQVAQVMPKKAERPVNAEKPVNPVKPDTPTIPEAQKPQTAVSNLHYASQTLTKDTVPYQDPARVDEFIAKMAAFNNVKQGELKCSQPIDSHVVSSVYVFPDNKEMDIFGRLLQVACCYSDETPGYRLSFSHQQFFFELKDVRQQLQYRWIAERVNGKILLYGTHAPLGTKESSACYQEYRDELMHTNSINKKPTEI